MQYYRVKKTVLDSSSFGLANEGDLVEVADLARAEAMIKDGILEREEMKKAKYFTKVEQVAEKAVEVPVTPEDLDVSVDAPEEAPAKKPGRPKKEE